MALLCTTTSIAILSSIAGTMVGVLRPMVADHLAGLRNEFTWPATPSDGPLPPQVAPTPEPQTSIRYFVGRDGPELDFATTGASSL